jgi:pimeloyl-ACP methyl ester carboxylesterase
LDIDYLGGEELQSIIGATVQSEDKNAKFHIVGDSFGTMVALQYVLFHNRNNTQRNRHIQSMVLNGPIPCSKEYVDRGWDPDYGTIGTMPTYFRQRYFDIVQKQDFVENPEFEAMEQILSTTFLYRSGIMADCFLRAIARQNHEIYQQMWSVSEFVALNGTLASFNMYPAIRELVQEPQQLPPILVTSGEFDTVREWSAIKLNDLWQQAGGHVERYLFEHSGHGTIGGNRRIN